MHMADLNFAGGWTAAPLAAGVRYFPPLVVLALCLLAGVGTVLLLPGRREAAVRKIGGALLLAALLLFVAILLRQAAGYSAGEVYFWIFSAIAVISAIRVITHPRPVYSALYFVLTVVASAGLFVLLWAEFMAAALILIYAGAILVTYVFVIMLAAQAQSAGTGLEEQGAEYDLFSREPVLASAVGFVLMGLIIFLIFEKAPAAGQLPRPAALEAGVGVSDLGRYLFSSQLVNLELAGLLLTIAMVGAVIIARRPVAGVAAGEAPSAEMMNVPGTPVDDNPHSIPVYGTKNPEAKAYPEA